MSSVQYVGEYPGNSEVGIRPGWKPVQCSVFEISKCHIDKICGRELRLLAVDAREQHLQLVELEQVAVTAEGGKQAPLFSSEI